MRALPARADGDRTDANALLEWLRALKGDAIWTEARTALAACRRSNGSLERADELAKIMFHLGACAARASVCAPERGRVCVFAAAYHDHPLVRLSAGGLLLRHASAGQVTASRAARPRCLG